MKVLRILVLFIVIYSVFYNIFEDTILETVDFAKIGVPALLLCIWIEIEVVKTIKKK